MNERYIDPSMERKNNAIDGTLETIEKTPLFSIIELNIYGTCNRNCSFCPVSNPDVYEKRHEGISVELYNKLLDDLVEINYQGNIVFSAYCEPLLHKELETLISNTKSKLPNVKIEIVSNGDLLSIKKLNSIFDAGLDAINISMYDGEHQIQHFNTMAKSCSLDDSQMILRRRYFQDGNYGMTISNRTGLVDSNEFRDEKEHSIIDLPLKSKCYYPFYMILVDYDGSVLFCSHDWGKSLKVDNIKNNSIWDIWQNKILNNVRKNLSNFNRDFKPCNTCDVLGTAMGKDSYDSWINSGLLEK